HLYHRKLQEDAAHVMQRALDAGVHTILMPAIDRNTPSEVDRLPKLDGLRCLQMAGIHPCDVHEAPLITEQELSDWAQRVHAIGIGETGLDYYWSKDHIDAQKHSL
ncbi:TatD family hydrolase, partial [Arthrospira platensis SPKY1]|nr:TatD family hydrolase [Arthrospira platensis SPKY1]